jgi:integrase
MGIELTDRVARAAQPPATGMRLIWDTEVKGFALRVTKAGAKAFVLSYRASGVQRQITIGSFPDWPTKAARDRAKELKRQVDMGQDPMLERHQDRAAPTMADLADHYAKVHLPRKRLGSQLADRTNLGKHVLPRLGTRKLTAIRHADIAALHRQISERTPIAANRTISLLSTMFALAIREEWVDANPCKGVQRNGENRRERYLAPAEIARLVEALQIHPDRSSADAILLLLLTGSRRGEVLSASWSEIDLDAGVWVKPSAHTKQKRAHRTPLSEGAVALLRQIKDRQTAEIETARRRGIIRPMPHNLFPGTGTRALQAVRRTWSAVCLLADRGGWLRRDSVSPSISGAPAG